MTPSCRNFVTLRREISNSKWPEVLRRVPMIPHPKKAKASVEVSEGEVVEVAEVEAVGAEAAGAANEGGSP